MAKVRRGDKFGYVDRSGRIRIVLRYDEDQSFKKGLARVKLGRKRHFIDTTRSPAIRTSFVNANDFNDGLAYVWIVARSGYINKKSGQFVSVDS